MNLTAGLAGLNTLKSLYEMAQKAIDSNDPEKLREAAGQMLEAAISARAQAALLQDERNAAVMELATLKAEIEKAQHFDDEAKNYTRERTHTGATVYREKDAPGQEGQSPYFCPNCFAHKQISMLNPAPRSNTMMGVCDYICAVCNTAMPLHPLRIKI